MAKQGGIKHYRQTGAAKAPPSLPFGELAVAKDGTLFAGNEANKPVQAGMQMELLWENASPNSNFPAQTLPLDLTGYSHAGISAKWFVAPIQTEDGIKIYRIDSAPKSIDSTAAGVVPSCGRAFAFSNGKIVFQSAYVSGTYQNDYIIPLEIYGIRGVTV